MLRTCSIIIARAEIGEFVEYDLDNEDEDWLQDYNRDRKTLEAEKYILLVFDFIFHECIYIISTIQCLFIKFFLLHMKSAYLGLHFYRHIILLFN